MRLELWPKAKLAELTKELIGLLNHPRFRGWIATDNGLPVAFAEAHIREFANGCEGRPVPFLEGIWVKKSHRRKGIGTKLITAVKTWALKRGFSELGSDAYITDRLSHLSHRGWGFKETERVVYFRKKLRKN